MKSEQVVAFVLEPSGYCFKSPPVSFLSKNRSRNSASSRGSTTDRKEILNVSGELVPYGTIQVEILPSILNVIVPEWQDFDRWSREWTKKYGNKAGTI